MIKIYMGESFEYQTIVHLIFFSGLSEKEHFWKSLRFVHSQLLFFMDQREGPSPTETHF